MKLLLSFFMLFSPLMSFIPNQDAIIIASYCYLYSSPSFSSEIVKIDENPFILYHNEKVTIIEENEDFILVKTQNEQTQGWVYKYYLTTNTSQIVYPVFNASVRNDNTIIYDINKSPTELKANAGQRVYLYDGFDDKNEFTAVQLLLEDGSLYNGYLKSADISPDGVSSLLIVGISIIAACVTIILSIIFIKKTKKNKSK